MDMGELEMRIQGLEVEKQYNERRMDLLTSKLKNYFNSISAQILDPGDNYGIYESPSQDETMKVEDGITLKHKF